jgi:hypothetical protein
MRKRKEESPKALQSNLATHPHPLPRSPAGSQYPTIIHPRIELMRAEQQHSKHGAGREYNGSPKADTGPHTHATTRTATYWATHRATATHRHTHNYRHSNTHTTPCTATHTHTHMHSNTHTTTCTATHTQPHAQQHTHLVGKVPFGTGAHIPHQNHPCAVCRVHEVPCGVELDAVHVTCVRIGSSAQGARTQRRISSSSTHGPQPHSVVKGPSDD